MNISLPSSLAAWHWLDVTEGDTRHVFLMGTSTEQHMEIPSLLLDSDLPHNNDVTHVKPTGIKTSSESSFPDAIIHTSGSMKFWYYSDSGGDHPYADMMRVTIVSPRVMYLDHITVQAHYNVATPLLPVSIECTRREWKLQSHEAGSDYFTCKITDRSSDVTIFTSRENRWDPPKPASIWSKFVVGPVTSEYDQWGWVNIFEFKYVPLTYSYAETIQKFREKSWIFDMGRKPPRVEAFQAEAFYNAYQQFPKFADNNVANLIDMFDFVKDAFTGAGVPLLLQAAHDFSSFLKGGARPRKLFKDLGSLWLSYRYAYSTTKSDTIQAIQNCARNQITYLTHQHFNGIYQDVVGSTDNTSVVCRVSFDVVQQTSDMIRSLKHYSYLHGLDLSAYTVWDLVPFSFIADWFCDIGGKLQRQNDIDHYSDYIVSNVVWSLKYEAEVSQVQNTFYSRWYDNNIPTEGLARCDNASSKTWLKRGADVVSISM